MAHLLKAFKRTFQLNNYKNFKSMQTEANGAKGTKGTDWDYYDNYPGIHISPAFMGRRCFSDGRIFLGGGNEAISSVFYMHAGGVCRCQLFGCISGSGGNGQDDFSRIQVPSI